MTVTRSKQHNNLALSLYFIMLHCLCSINVMPLDIDMINKSFVIRFLNTVSLFFFFSFMSVIYQICIKSTECTKVTLLSLQSNTQYSNLVWHVLQSWPFRFCLEHRQLSCLCHSSIQLSVSTCRLNNGCSLCSVQSYGTFKRKWANMVDW